MNIEDKFNLDDIYIAERPGPYMQFSLEKEYFMPEFGRKYFQSLLEKSHASLQHPVNVMDLGASYGVLSTLILKGISWQNLIDFYVTDGKINDNSWEEIKGFYKGLVHDDKYKFYLVDSSPAAMQFANNVGVCEQAFTFDLLKSTLTKELAELIRQIDVFTIAGAINYLGLNSFN